VANHFDWLRWGNGGVSDVPQPIVLQLITSHTFHPGKLHKCAIRPVFEFVPSSSVSRDDIHVSFDSSEKCTCLGSRRETN
jgi:hypothetical protein